MKRIVVVSVGLALALLGTGAQAAFFDFDGYIDYHNEVDTYPFTLLSDATLVEIWTDSYDGGANLDPITALWDAGTGALIAQNDDNSSIRPAEQTIFDSGISIASLSAGDYFFTLAAFPNFANASTIADGFRYDGATPIPIVGWSTNGGPYYHLNFSGDVLVTPLPGAIVLGMLGLSVAGVKLRRHR
jgi:hypothetical protein